MIDCPICQTSVADIVALHHHVGAAHPLGDMAVLKETPAPKGRGVRREVGTMNKTEAAYSLHLECLKAVGEVLDFQFEAVKLKLAAKTFYTPDFFVLAADEVCEVHEVKGGFWEDDAKVKIKVAARLFPFRFFAVYAVPKKEGGGWRREAF